MRQFLRRGVAAVKDIPDYLLPQLLTLLNGARDESYYVSLSKEDQRGLLCIGMDCGMLFQLPRKCMGIVELKEWVAARAESVGSP